MKISVLIPSYNSAATIEAALESVFAQTVPADEVIVLLDGGTDDTESRLAKFGSRIRLLTQPNQGVARSRNRLVAEAKGELLAFLDSDDLWHPKYLDSQCRQLSENADACAGFTGHVRFLGEDYTWNQPPAFSAEATGLLDPAAFFIGYNVETAKFGSMSYLAVTRKAFDKLGEEPFSADLVAAEDSYLCYQLALLGPVVFNPAPLVAYRLRNGSLSENRVRNTALWISTFERLEKRFKDQKSKRLAAAFRFFYAQKRREYAKVLMSAGRVGDARRQLIQSIGHCFVPSSMAKAMALLLLGGLPRPLQPQWLPLTRQIEAPSTALANK